MFWEYSSGLLKSLMDFVVQFGFVTSVALYLPGEDA